MVTDGACAGECSVWGWCERVWEVIIVMMVRGVVNVVGGYAVGGFRRLYWWYWFMGW